jgi:SAM-dependent methyltransferase
MPYASLTRNDRNPLKRFLQRRRLIDALSLAGDVASGIIVDYGAGDGETCKRLAARFPQARLHCYEPCEALRAEARENLRKAANAAVTGTCDELPQGQCDLVVCMEVFEHLPPAQTEAELTRIQSLLRDGGAALIGVPLEVFAPALVKGAFRMTRRFGQFDARPANILKAALGRPPQDRPLSEIAPGLPYHFHHLGFDHRRLRRQLEAHFRIERVVGSPLRLLGALLNSEVYFLARKHSSCHAPRDERSSRGE